MNCPISGVNIPRYSIALLVGFIFVSAYEYIFHGIILTPIYNATSENWRTAEEMNTLFPWLLLTQLLYTSVILKIFALFIRTKKKRIGLFYGALAGFIGGIIMFGRYVYMPIPFDLAVYWLIAAVIQGACLGLIFALIYQDAGKPCANWICKKEDKDKITASI